jgi:hypothetical protein
MQAGRNNGVIPKLNNERNYLTTVLPAALALERFLMSEMEECARDR